MIALTTLVWAFSEYCEEKFTIEPVEIVTLSDDKTFVSPDISEKKFLVWHNKA